ncbi:MAG: hypothetical protein ACOH5I_16960 [Oligoflexus sp.]
MSAHQFGILTGLFFSIFILTNCSKAPPPPPIGGSTSAAGVGDTGNVSGTTFNAETYFNGGCQACHVGDSALKPLVDTDYDGSLVEFVKELPEHTSYQATWPEGEDAEALADYINTEVAEEP